MNVASSIIAALVFVLALAASGIANAAHAALRQLPRGRARRLRDAGAPGGRALDRLSDRPSRLAAARALAVGTGYAAVAAVGAWALQRLWPELPSSASVFVAVVATTTLMYALGEAAPRALAIANPETVGLSVAPLAEALVAALYPAARVLSFVWTRVIALVSGGPAPEVPWTEPEEERRTAAEENAEADPASDEDLLEAVSELHTKVVREVMVPRTDMVTLPDDATLDDALAAITGAGVSRVPVYRGSLDDIVGVLYAKDLLARLGECDAGDRGLPAAPLARPALFVPETKPVEELLREMRRRTHIAIVADEYGGTAGLVTIEDLLEEIVGEIFDEYDPQVALVTAVAPGRWLVDARLPVDELDELVGTALDVEADTAGGLFTELAGHIPQVGESVEVEGVRLRVESMEGHRVRHLIVETGSATETKDGR